MMVGTVTPGAVPPFFLLFGMILSSPFFLSHSSQSPKNVGNLGTGFLRKVSKGEEGLTRSSCLNVAKTDGKG